MTINFLRQQRDTSIYFNLLLSYFHLIPGIKKLYSMKKIHLPLAICLILILNSCVSYQNLTSNQIDQYYSASIVDASYPEADEISSGLLAVSTENQNLIWKEIEGKRYLKVATWTSYDGYKENEAYQTSSRFLIWVTVAPQLKEWYQSRKPKELKNRDLRLKQLLGLPPNVEKKYFVEFWVQPDDLFRPCADKEVADNACDLCFPDETDTNHKEWIKNLRNDSYYNCEGDKYPWTQLGYTYDWYPGNKSHIGLSEFVIKGERNIFVDKIYPTEQYFLK